MVEYNSAETLDVIDTYSTDVMTGGSNKRMYLYNQLVNSLKRADSVDIIVSFLMESGVKMLIKEFENALKRGARIRILTGNYLGITQPSALYLIRKRLGEQVDIRFYNEKNRSFHPKSYIFHYEDYSELYIGSSNISKSALTSGIEWNYRFNSRNDKDNYEKFFNTFEDLFYNHSIVIDDEELKRYSKNWHKPAVSKDLERYDEEYYSDIESKVRPLFEPRGAQIEALCSLDDTRSEGAKRALVFAATGVGKTYLAAFDSVNYEKVLFVAHREEIIRQAANSFKNVRNSDNYGFFTGNEKCTDKPVIFASVASLGKDTYLNERYFKPDYFDYIVIDEFHHAVNEQYRKIVDYFKPQFLLGLTATPERMDGRNIYEICDYNVSYEVSLKEAINKGILVPFHYYGICDIIDYSNINIVNGLYDKKELNEVYIKNTERYDMIYKYYMKYGSKRALGFCCTREHAEAMAEDFCKRGIPSVAVYSNSDGEFSEDRKTAINRLIKGDIRVIFSVDMFNEGVDIPSVDMVMFLRPTESPVVFIQQLGRGLRRSKGKEYLNVLDFIGNYQKAGRVRSLLAGDKAFRGNNYNPIDKSVFPDDCIIDFDMRLIDIFAKMDKQQLKIREQIQNEYLRIKEMLGRVPSRIELFTYMDDDIYEMALTHSKDNIFKNYMDYLKENGDLKQDEENVYQSAGREFINYIETTNMSKVYKMPVLMAFYNNGIIRMEVTKEQILESWKDFFSTGTNWKDIDKSSDFNYDKYRAITDSEHIKKIMQMPVKYLLESGKGLFIQKDGCALALRDNMQQVIGNEAFVRHMKDALEYRVMDYYRRRYTLNSGVNNQKLSMKNDNLR
jgi:superfamily II DNA or RNA helicase/HKD family nuclease